MRRLSFDQTEPALDLIQAGIDAVDTNRNTRSLNLQITDTRGQFEHSLVQRVELLTNRAQMLEDDIVRFSHVRSLAQVPSKFERRYAASPAYCA